MQGASRENKTAFYKEIKTGAAFHHQWKTAPVVLRIVI